MISSVMNMASVVSTWLGGSCCVPIACRSSPKTTTIRMKLVVMRRIAGAKLSTVSRSITCSVELRRCGLVHDSGPPRSASTTGSGKSGAGGLALDEAALRLLTAKLSERLAKRDGRAAGLAAAAQGQEVFDLGGLGNFGQRLNADGRKGDE